MAFSHHACHTSRFSRYASTSHHNPSVPTGPMHKSYNRFGYAARKNWIHTSVKRDLYRILRQAPKDPVQISSHQLNKDAAIFYPRLILPEIAPSISIIASPPTYPAPVSLGSSVVPPPPQYVYGTGKADTSLADNSTGGCELGADGGATSTQLVDTVAMSDGNSLDTAAADRSTGTSKVDYSTADSTIAGGEFEAVGMATQFLPVDTASTGGRELGAVVDESPPLGGDENDLQDAVSPTRSDIVDIVIRFLDEEDVEAENYICEHLADSTDTGMYFDRILVPNDILREAIPIWHRQQGF